MSLRVANLAEAAIGRLWDGGTGHGPFVRASVSLCSRFPARLTDEHIYAFRLAAAIDLEAERPRDPRKRQLIRALGLTLIAELAERGEL